MISLSTHVLDTGAGDPAEGVLVVLYRGDMFLAETRTDGDGRARLAESLDPGTYRLVFHPPSPFFKRVELEIALDDGPLPRPAPRLALLVRELPRQLSADELAELFEGRTRLVERLAELDDPLGRADEVLADLSEEEQVEAFAAHPAIGARSGLSARSAAEQGGDADPVILSELAYLNQVYEEKFGFRFVVFVNGRPKAEILDVLRDRLGPHARGGARVRRCVSSSRSRRTGGRGLPEGRRRPLPPAAARRRGDRLDRRVVLLHPARPRPAADAPRSDAARGVAGEYWGVHGGGFYHSQKYRVAPERLPEHLHWFKWEAYTTWLSGFALLVAPLLARRAANGSIDPASPTSSRGRRSPSPRRVSRSPGSSTTSPVASSATTATSQPPSPCSCARRPSQRTPSSRRGRPSSRSAPCSARSWPPTSSSSSSRRTGSSCARSSRDASPTRARACGQSSGRCTTTT